jgi:N-acetylglucosamine-6-phosphate deacetylase
MEQLAICGGEVHAPNAVIADGVVLIRDGTIAAVGPAEQVAVPPEAERFDARGCIVAPGFVDIHNHGGAGGDFSDDDDEAIELAVRHHAGGGTTALLATTGSTTREHWERIAERLERAMQWRGRGATVIGWHAEGPFLNMEMRGCHLPEMVRPPTPDDVDWLLEQRGLVRHVTLAPELDYGLTATERLAEAGITVSAGHTTATAELLYEAVRRGLSHSTHMFCAMGSVTADGPRRVPGAVEGILASDSITTEIICDGFHLDPVMIELAYRAKGPQQLALCTDAMRGAGMPDGAYTSCLKIAYCRGGVAIMPEGTGYASSCIRMNDNLKTVRARPRIPLREAIQMASLVPARIADIADRKGSLEAGKDADVAVLNRDLDVVLTVAEGRVVYRATSP